MIYKKSIDFDGLDLEELKRIILSQVTLNTNGCWIWNGVLNGQQYGGISIKPYLSLRIHRVSLKLFKPDEYVIGEDVLHKCNETFCINPDHLYSGDSTQNHRDTVKAGNHPQAKKTHCPQGHLLFGDNLYVNSKRRHCKLCAKRRMRKYRLKKNQVR